MTQFIFRLILTLLCIVISSVSSFAQTDEIGRWVNGVAEPWFFNNKNYSEEQVILAQNRWRVIEAENNSSKESGWAGDYSYGEEVHLTVLRWSPKSGFVKFGVYTCLPEVRHVDYGTVLASPEFIQMYSEIPRNGSESISVKYLPVKWGKRHYLISENQIAEFYNYVAGYGSKIDEYVPLDFLLQDGDGNKPVEGMPVFPPGYERFVKKPIDATITAVSARVLKRRRNDDGSFFYESHIPVTLNVGSTSGVKSGVSFNVLASETNETVEIIRVGKDSSTGVIIRWLDDNLSETYKDWETDETKPLPTISVGWQLSTRPTNP